MKRAGKTPRGGNRLHARIGNPSSGGGAAEGKFFHFKGLVEKSFTDVGFAGGLAIFRPAGLLGTGHTPALVDWLLPNIDRMVPARFRCIHIQKLAYAMASVAVDATRTAQGGSARKVTGSQGATP